MDGNLRKDTYGKKSGQLYSGIKILIFFVVLFLMLGSLTKIV